MKYISRLFSLVIMMGLGISTAAAQLIYNSSFEDWDTTQAPPIYEEPVDWTSSNIFSAGLPAGPGVVRSNQNVSGKLSANINTVVYGITLSPFAGFIVNGETYVDGLGLPYPITGGTPIAVKPVALKGFYQYSSNGGDLAIVEVILKKYNTTLGRADTIGYAYKNLNPANGFTPFNISIADWQPGVQPDSIVIGFFSTDPWNPMVGGQLWVDSLELVLPTVDVGVSSIASPGASVMVNDMQDISVWVKNFGTVAADNFPIIFDMPGVMTETDTFMATIQAGDSAMHTFQMQWTPNMAGMQSICAHTMLAGDADVTNDTLCKNIQVTGITDGAVTAILSPDAMVAINTPQPVTLMVKNKGTLPIKNFDLAYRVDANELAVAAFPDSILPGDSAQYTFANMWTPTETGAPDFCGYIKSLTGDVNSTNNTTCQTLSITTGIHDADQLKHPYLYVAPYTSNGAIQFHYFQEDGGRAEVYSLQGSLLNSMNLVAGEHVKEMGTGSLGHGVMVLVLKSATGEVQLHQMILPGH